MKFELGGDDWTFKGFISEDWRWRRAHLPDSPDLRWYWPESVPGSVTDDLWRAGQIRDPYYERNGYTFVVNGRKVYAKGWNWVPIDVLYGVPRPEKRARLLELARRAHVNLLRVWGGGLIETEAFYKLCDRYGILVWQELIQSSSVVDNHPPEDAEFAAMLITEAEQIIPRRRNHPSLAVWCGGNELMDWDSKPAGDGIPLLAALRDAVERLDPGRAWRPTSPSGPLFENSLENIARAPDALHAVHGPWEYQGLTEQYTLYNRGSSLFHSEFGVDGYTNERTIEAHITPANPWPATRDNPVYLQTASWWIKEATLQAAFGDLLLLPGESRTIAAEWHNVPEPDRHLQVQGWNTPTVVFS